MRVESEAGGSRRLVSINRAQRACDARAKRQRKNRVSSSFTPPSAHWGPNVRCARCLDLPRVEAEQRHCGSLLGSLEGYKSSYVLLHVGTSHGQCALGEGKRRRSARGARTHVPSRQSRRLVLPSALSTVLDSLSTHSWSRGADLARECPQTNGRAYLAPSPGTLKPILPARVLLIREHRPG